jgi:hypothetical protein
LVIALIVSIRPLGVIGARMTGENIFTRQKFFIMENKRIYIFTIFKLEKKIFLLLKQQIFFFKKKEESFDQ